MYIGTVAGREYTLRAMEVCLNLQNPVVSALPPDRLNFLFIALKQTDIEVFTNELALTYKKKGCNV